ncbi:hypothetical protein DSO57_1028673 [Entomophthora muscae]|uniref:Uncharacterized protein n=1 Tax=Entomophthora muscae TaxID=34485 RepID=A0ACC2S3A7_9FUNG|nr:hypothetical protein DSO57_1028673 [Entomophthora muscae]
MVWMDGTATIYNGYQDLGLLENIPRKPSFPPALGSTKAAGSSGFSPQAVVLTPTNSASGLERVESNESSKSLPEFSEQSTDAGELPIRRVISKGTNPPHKLQPSRIQISRSQPASGRDSGTEDNNDENSRTRRSDSIKGTFNIKSSPQLPTPPTQPMAQPFLTIDKHLPIDRGIICMSVSPSKDLLVTVTISSVELWSLNPILFLCQITRSTDTIVTNGVNTDISWKDDSRSFCIFAST